MKFSNPYLHIIEKIELLQRWVIVHSYLYYELDSPVVDDYKYDANCIQLMKYKEKYPKSYKKSKYFYVMYDFDGSTGFGIYQKLKEEHYDNVQRDATLALNLKRRKDNSGKR